MERRPNARDIVIIVGRCSRTKGGAGIRFERKPDNAWSATWAFPIKEAAARREGYDQSEISGLIGLDPSYPGCPHCQSRSIFRCGACTKVGCWDGETRIVTCPWCGNRAELEGHITSLASREDL